ncbi:MAG: hypothetical protein KTR30_36165, partial [Saprospiraceae bacterium]|nr:hypothetical protein [Saprospiraceae bacterium]
MKTKTILRVKHITLTLLLSLFFLNLSAQELPDFGVNLKKGDLYYLDYEVSKLFGFRPPNHMIKPYKADTQGVVKRIIRIEVLEELPNQEYLLALASERGASKFNLGVKTNVFDDAYPEEVISRISANSAQEFSFGAITVPLNQGLKRIPLPKFTHLKVDANLSVLKVYQNEKDARLDQGKTPDKPLHLWLDFDLIGIWLQPDELELAPYLTPIWKTETPSPDRSTDYLQYFTANYIDAFTVDTKSGWLHFAQLREKKGVSSTKNMTVLKTIKGWKGKAKKRTIVHGYAMTTKGVIRKENLTELVPFYFDKGRENLMVDTNGYFRWETYIDQPTYFSLRDLKGDDLHKVYGYVQPGDELYMEVNFDRLETLVFKGKNESANQFLNQNDGLPLPGLTEWRGQITVPINRWARKEVNELVKTARKKSLERLKQHKKILDPRFYQDEYWRLTYSLARFIKPTPDNDTIIPTEKFLPIVNMQAEHLPAFWAYIETFAKHELQQHQQHVTFGSHLSLRERYNSSKLFLSGFPQHIVMYHALREALHHKKASHEEVAFMKNEFLALCKDENLTTNIRSLVKQLDQTKPGKYFQNFQLFDTQGSSVEMKKFIGKKVVLEPAFNSNAGRNPRNYQQLQEKYPGIQFVCLELSGYPEFLQDFKDIQAQNPSSSNSQYYLANHEELERAYRFLALDPHHPYSDYPHFFFLDEKGQIT